MPPPRVPPPPPRQEIPGSAPGLFMKITDLRFSLPLCKLSIYNLKDFKHEIKTIFTNSCIDNKNARVLEQFRFPFWSTMFIKLLFIGQNVYLKRNRRDRSLCLQKPFQLTGDVGYLIPEFSGLIIIMALVTTFAFCKLI